MSPVDVLRRHLDAHDPSSGEERAHVAALLAALDDLVAPLDEESQATHVTGSAIVLPHARDDRTVLVRHKRLDRWLQPGGHVEVGETVHDAAARETTEETGLEVVHPSDGPTLVHVHVHDGGRGHVHLDVRYLLLADPAQPFAPGPGESRTLDWFGVEDLAALADDSVTAAVDAARRLHGSFTN